VGLIGTKSAAPPRKQALTALALLALSALAVIFLRVPLLQMAGRLLVVSGQAEPAADVIVLAIDAGSDAALDAADLVRRGTAPRVAVFGEPTNRIEREFARRGVPYEDKAERLIRQLGLLGVKEARRISTPVVGTENEAAILPQWCLEHGFRTAIVVTSVDHSRRLRRVLHRAMKGSAAKLIVYPSHYSTFDADRWWTTRDGTRTAIEEGQKLLLDVILHPIS
jgi:uncharacterized SAM-binding protein YcdF (DUF218 family)